MSLLQESLEGLGCNGKFTGQRIKDLNLNRSPGTKDNYINSLRINFNLIN